MSFNESLTLVLSGLALLVSVLSAIISFRQAKTESRDQLNDLIQELVKTQSEKPDPSTMVKTAFLARQAAAIVEKDPDIATDVDYSVTATAFGFLGDGPRADGFWKKSVELSPSDFYLVVNQRGYASFLFSVGKHEQGRQLYQDALKKFDATSDFNKYTNGFTYQMWFYSEAWNLSQSFSDANNCYNKARGLFESISSPHRKSRALYDLDQCVQQLPQQPPATNSPFLPGQAQVVPATAAP